MAPSYIAAAVMLIAAIFPHVSATDIETTIRTIIEIAGSIVVLIHQLSSGQSTLFGATPSRRW